MWTNVKMLQDTSIELSRFLQRKPLALMKWTLRKVKTNFVFFFFVLKLWKNKL